VAWSTRFAVATVERRHDRCSSCKITSQTQQRCDLQGQPASFDEKPLSHLHPRRSDVRDELADATRLRTSFATRP